MQILLGPDSKKAQDLRNSYNKAFNEAEELYIASAYLTDWDVENKVSEKCKAITFIVGTDFGLTKKVALHNALKWMPQNIPAFFGALPPQSGFHPKIIAWRVRNKYYCIIGSSNLSKAAFSSNYEANILSEIPLAKFKMISIWLDEISELAQPVNKDWIDYHYKEAPPVSKKNRVKPPSIELDFLPQGRACKNAVRARRAQQATFHEIANKIKTAATSCTKGKITNSKFWEAFWKLWSGHESRFQGQGIQFKGKNANWKQACDTLIKIIEASKTLSVLQLDHFVSSEIDRLKIAKNPMRSAWLSEMLCHYFPKLYPVNNAPVQRWIAKNKWRGRRGATQGQRYIELAQKLRCVVRDHHPAGSNNLAELDSAIWRWVDDNLPVKKQKKKA